MKWALHPQAIECEECERVFGINDDVPPCEKDINTLLPEDVCQKPADLLVANRASFQIWKECSEFSRKANAMGGLAVLTRREIKEVAEDYDANNEDVDKALAVEKVAFPILLQKQNESQEVKKDGSQIQNKHRRINSSTKRVKKRS